MRNSITKFQAATAIAVFFHIIGLVGILFLDKHFFIKATPLNLLLSLALLIWTQPQKNGYYLLFIGLTFLIGFISEVIGVNTGLLFGDYNYGSVLGPKLFQVPLLIGVNWIIVIYCCGVSTHSLLMTVIKKLNVENKEATITIKAISVIVDGATLAVLFDWLMEPVAVRLGFWTWLGDGAIPSYNYFCWFVISALLLGAFHFLPFGKRNKFAVNLLLIQGMFFLVLRSFLP